tara:strand:- start:3392 stop:3628 length:237 start_codon:yes stop_codon:yes gene_type:complete
MTKEKETEMIFDLAEDFAPYVNKIENSMATTRNHYGNYGSMLNQLSKGSKPMANLLALAMVKAGANAQGVADGLKNFC